MIKYLEDKHELTILFNDQIIIKHHRQKPAIYLGRGEESIECYRGNYVIEDRIDERIGLKHYELKDDKILFKHEETVLEMSFSEHKERLHIAIKSNDDSNRFWIRFHATPDEKVYGGGEQYSHFNLRGRRFPLWTSEAGVGRSEKSLTKYYADLYDRAGGSYYTTYYPEPTFVSTRKYWLHVDSYAYGELNFRHTHYHELHFWEVPKEIIISYQKSYLDIVENLTDYTGRAHQLPDFLTDGIILGLQGGTEKVLDYLRLAEESDIKVSGLWCQDWAGYRYTTFGKRLYWNWILNDTHYPRLKEAIVELDKKGVAFLTYICPFLLEDESLFTEAKQNDYLALNKEGAIYRVDFGEFYCGIVDLTNPKAFDWYKNIIKTNIIDMGIKGWMADFGEYLPSDCVLSNGVDARIMHNQWPVLWAKCNYEAVKEAHKLGDVFYFMRAGAHGSQHYATSLWAGDQSVNWEPDDGIPSVIPAALSAGIIGNAFTHSDIGGYTSLYGNVRSQELFQRWLEMNVFTTFMRTHEGNRPDNNFQFHQNPETLKLMSRMIAVRQDLKPYIKHLIDEGANKGYPVQRPLFMHYEQDDRTYDIQYQYLFGADMLVAPVIEKGKIKQEVYLPDDEWIHLWTGKPYKGGTTIELECPFGYPPVLYRKHSNFRKLFESLTKRHR